MLAAGQVAIRLVPTWSLIADVDSKINPNDQLAAWNGSAQIEPVSAEILTQPAWRATYLTPGASIFVPPIIQGIPTSTTESNNTPPATQGPGASSTPGQPTAANSSTPIIIIIPTNTSIPPTKVSTKVPTAAPTVTRTTTTTATVTSTVTPTLTVLAATQTTTLTGTATVTSTSMASTVTPTTAVTVAPTSTVTNTSIVPDTVTPTLMPTVTETAYVPPSCNNNIYINEPPVSTTYTLKDGENNCLVYKNIDHTKYIKGGIFTITNVNAGKRTFHYSCGGSPAQLNLNNGDTGTLYVDRNGDDMAVTISNQNGGDVKVEVAEWNDGSCPVSAFEPQPGGIAWYLGLLAMAVLFGVLMMGMSSTRL